MTIDERMQVWLTVYCAVVQGVGKSDPKAASDAAEWMADAGLGKYLRQRRLLEMADGNGVKAEGRA